MLIFLSCTNLYSITSLKLYHQFTKTKIKFREKLANSGFNYKEESVVLTVHKLSEHDFCQKWLKFYDKIDLPIRMKIIYNVKHC